MEQKIALELRNITKTFGDFTALDNLSMTVPKGTVYGLVGPNGAGKSTAIRHMLGVYRPDSGSVTLDGAPIYENPEAKMRIGSIPDDVFFFTQGMWPGMMKDGKIILDDLGHVHIAVFKI